MAYKRRKQIVEAQIREHNLARAEQKNTRTCPMAKTTQENPTQETTEQVANETNPTAGNRPADSVKNETTDKVAAPVVVNKNNKKIVVSIQTNEEKSKENIMSMSLQENLGTCVVLFVLF